MVKHFRDCKAWKEENLAMSTTNDESAKLFDNIIHQYVTWIEDPQNGGLEGTMKMLLELDPKFVMGNVLSVGLDLMGTSRSVRLDGKFSDQVKNLEISMRNDKNLSIREKLHCKAVVEFASEFYSKACETWEEILLQYPHDILALKFAHDAYFYLGNSIMIRDSAGRVLPQWNPKNTFYGYLKGMYAFGLEEQNLYTLANRHASEALVLNPTDCWATHARAHCFEMNGLTDKGIEFMKSTESDWKKGGMLACHNYWHWALYHIERGEYESALGIYDQEVGLRVNSGAALDIVDASSLLQRFEFQGVNVGERWENVYEICRPHVDDHIMVFNDVHFLMTYLRARKGKEEKTDELFMKSIEENLGKLKGTNHGIFSKVGVSLFKATIAYSEEKFDEAVELLYPLKNDVIIIGGSHAQRDVFNQLLIQACMKSSKPLNIKRGFALLNERKMVKEDSPLTDRMMNSILNCHGNLTDKIYDP